MCQNIAITIGTAKRPILVSKPYGLLTYKLFCVMPTKTLHQGLINTQVFVKNAPLPKLGIQNHDQRTYCLCIQCDWSIVEFSAKKRFFFSWNLRRGMHEETYLTPISSSRDQYNLPLIKLLYSLRYRIPENTFNSSLDFVNLWYFFLLRKKRCVRKN